MCTSQWTHSILDESDFTAPWFATERAIDQCISVHGFDACSQLLDGSKSLYADLRPRARHHQILRPVTFSSHVEVWYGRESDTLSSTILTHEQLGTWHDKPWTLDLDKHAAVVEPLSTEAVLIPTVCNSNYEPTCSQPRNHSADAHHAQIGDNAALLIPDAAPRPSDFAIYDMHSSWHLHLQVEWREHATSQYGGERILKIQTWYLHHQDTPRRQTPRSVELDYMDHLWLDDIREVWADRLRPGEVFHLTSVFPQPPAADNQPHMPHVIVSQGPQPDRIGVILTARFLEDHQTQLLQEAASSPEWMCGTRAVEMMHIQHLVQDRPWIARSGVMMFTNDELEEIPDGISINIDIRVPPADTDVVSFAAFQQQAYPPDQPIFHMPDVAMQGEETHNDSDHSSSDDDVQYAQGDDWRFAHVYRTRNRVYHGYVPWDSAFVFQERVSWLTGVVEDDIAYCHHVADPPEDLRAAHTEVLLMQTVADLPQGSLHRLVLVDIEFHEHLPSTDTSTSRRCLSLPHLTQRRSLLRLLGLDIYCDKVKSRCLMWLNNILVPMQRKSSFHLEHGDYLRFAIPPWPSAASSISTRQCVSNIRRHRSAIGRPPAPPQDPRHEIGMTESRTP